MHRKLVEPVRAGSQVAESVIVSGLTDKAAYRLESRIKANFTSIEPANYGIQSMSDLPVRCRGTERFCRRDLGPRSRRCDLDHVSMASILSAFISQEDKPYVAL